MSWPLRALLAALSGVLCGMVFRQASWPSVLRDVLEGGVFGALVLVPFVATVNRRLDWAVAPFLVAGGCITQFLCVRLLVALYGTASLLKAPWAAFAVAGLAGALLVAVLARFVVSLDTGRRFWLLTAAAGLAGGLLFGLLFLAGRGLAMTGFVAWQMLVCMALGLGSERALRPVKSP